jgi:hypothetical protein
MRTELRLLNQTEAIVPHTELAKNAGWYLPHEKICWVSERHNICKLKDGRIHSEDGPAIAYPDRFEIYALNGVRVPGWLVNKKQHELDPKLLLSDKSLKDNVEVRREFVRKVGVEWCLKVLGWRVLDKQNDYELGETNVIPDAPRRYLKMLNPSVKIWHIEAVHPSCNNVQEAINWRRYGDKNKTWNNYQLS